MERLRRDDELTYSIEHGAVGATCNPVIVLDVLKKEMPLWEPRIQSLIQEMPTATEDQIAWSLIEEISATRAALLRPIFELAQRPQRTPFHSDRSPPLPRSAAIVEQAVRFSELAPNMIVKIPVTRAGIRPSKKLPIAA